MTEHAFDEQYGPWIHCKCGWNHYNILSDALNWRALNKHLRQAAEIELMNAQANKLRGS